MTKPTKTSLLIPLLASTLIVVGIWFAWLVWVEHKFPFHSDTSASPPSTNDVMAHRGQYGDLFGGVNALLTGLGLSAALCALFFQRKDMIESLDRHAQSLNFETTVASLDVSLKLAEELQRDIESLAADEPVRKSLEAMLQSLRLEIRDDLKELKEVKRQLRALRQS
jgi:hypothetical protein